MFLALNCETQRLAVPLVPLRRQFHLARHRCAGSDERMAGFGESAGAREWLDERIPVIPADRPRRSYHPFRIVDRRKACICSARSSAPRASISKRYRPLARRSPSQPRNGRSELFTAYGPSDQQSEDRAIRTAKGLVSGHVGVIAWRREGDPALGDCSSPLVTFPTWNKI